MWSATLHFVILPLLVAIAAQPEMHGPYAVETLDVGSVEADGVQIPTRIYAPMSAERFPVVGVIHGAQRTGANQAVLAETFASHGFVAVVPDMPCGFLGCDHDANARQLSALLEWAVTTSPAADRIDGTRRALVGHSWGGLAVHLATARDPSIDAVVCLDPNDDGTVGYDAAPDVQVPNAALMAAVSGNCNATDWGANVYPRTGAPHLRVRVVGAAHCDVEDPSDNLCPIACGSGDPTLAYVFRRYAIAFVSCVLTGEDAEWIGGSSMTTDEAGGTIDGVDQRGLEALPCRHGLPPDDAGVAPTDAQTGLDAQATPDDAGTIDAGAPPPKPSDSGCQTVAPDTSAGLLLGLSALFLRKRRGAAQPRISAWACFAVT